MESTKKEKIFESINKYYTEKIIEYGKTPNGVDWKDKKSQIIRFEQLLKVINIKSKFTLGDLGCGYGSMYSFMKNSNLQDFFYYGYDLSKEMIENAQSIYIDNNNCKFYKINKITEIKDADYIIASGIFNVKMKYKEYEWQPYILETLEEINNKSKRGFAFNILTSYSEKEYMRDDLYYANPNYFFDYCKRNFSKNISLLHDYKLYEFTIIVRKD